MGAAVCAAQQRHFDGRGETEAAVITHDGRTMSLPQWAKLTGFRRSVIYQRLFRYGWPVRRALTETPRRGSLQICAAFDADPTQTSYELADKLGLDDSYVRAVLRRCGRKLMRTRGQKRCQQPTHS
jgi:hypothetical protein